LLCARRSATSFEWAGGAHACTLSRLVEEAAHGEPFVIAKAGKPLVKVIALDAPVAGQTRRLGFMAGQFTVPDNFDQMGADQIAQLFGVNP
jgi:antitoxin (DNA-binding transcriptional repressor) of toxin-antitoxin stability system